MVEEGASQGVQPPSSTELQAALLQLQAISQALRPENPTLGQQPPLPGLLDALPHLLSPLSHAAPSSKSAVPSSTATTTPATYRPFVSHVYGQIGQLLTTFAQQGSSSSSSQPAQWVRLVEQLQSGKQWSIEEKQQAILRARKRRKLGGRGMQGPATNNSDNLVNELMSGQDSNDPTSSSSPAPSIPPRVSFQDLAKHYSSSHEPDNTSFEEVVPIIRARLAAISADAKRFAMSSTLESGSDSLDHAGSCTLLRLSPGKPKGPAKVHFEPPSDGGPKIGSGLISIDLRSAGRGYVWFDLPEGGSSEADGYTVRITRINLRSSAEEKAASTTALDVTTSATSSRPSTAGGKSTQPAVNSELASQRLKPSSIHLPSTSAFHRDLSAHLLRRCSTGTSSSSSTNPSDPLLPLTECLLHLLAFQNFFSATMPVDFETLKLQKRQEKQIETLLGLGTTNAEQPTAVPAPGPEEPTSGEDVKMAEGSLEEKSSEQQAEGIESKQASDAEAQEASTTTAAVADDKGSEVKEVAASTSKDQVEPESKPSVVLLSWHSPSNQARQTAQSGDESDNELSGLVKWAWCGLVDDKGELLKGKEDEDAAVDKQEQTQGQASGSSSKATVTQMWLAFPSSS